MNKKISLVLTVLMVLGIVFGALVRPVQAYRQTRLGPKEPYSFHDSDLRIYRATEYVIINHSEENISKYIFI